MADLAREFAGPVAQEPLAASGLGRGRARQVLGEQPLDDLAGRGSFEEDQGSAAFRDRGAGRVAQLLGERVDGLLHVGRGGQFVDGLGGERHRIVEPHAIGGLGRRGNIQAHEGIPLVRPGSVAGQEALPPHRVHGVDVRGGDERRGLEEGRQPGRERPQRARLRRREDGQGHGLRRRLRGEVRDLVLVGRALPAGGCLLFSQGVDGALVGLVGAQPECPSGHEIVVVEGKRAEAANQAGQSSIPTLLKIAAVEACVPDSDVAAQGARPKLGLAGDRAEGGADPCEFTFGHRVGGVVRTRLVLDVHLGHGAAELVLHGLANGVSAGGPGRGRRCRQHGGLVAAFLFSLDLDLLHQQAGAGGGHGHETGLGAAESVEGLVVVGGRHDLVQGGERRADDVHPAQQLVRAAVGPYTIDDDGQHLEGLRHEALGVREAARDVPKEQAERLALPPGLVAQAPPQLVARHSQRRLHDQVPLPRHHIAAFLPAAVPVRVVKAAGGRAAHEEVLEHAALDQRRPLRRHGLVVEAIEAVERLAADPHDRRIVVDRDEAGHHCLAHLLGEGLPLHVPLLAMALHAVTEDLVEKDGRGLALQDGGPDEGFRQRRPPQGLEVRNDRVGGAGQGGLVGQPRDLGGIEALVSLHVHAVLGARAGLDG